MPTRHIEWKATSNSLISLQQRLWACRRVALSKETDHRRGTSVITAYAQVPIAHADPITRWGILIHIDQNNLLAPIRSFLWELSVLAILILLPLLGLVLGMIKTLNEEWTSTKREFERAADAEMALKKTDGGSPFVSGGRTEVGVSAGPR